MGQSLQLNPSSRLLLLSPHPDDETIACGGLLQRARAAGATTRVVYFTRGEDNPLPQFCYERRLCIGKKSKSRWGETRQREALAALQRVGVAADNVDFLGLPDQRVTDALFDRPAETIVKIVHQIESFAPTHLVFPSLWDHHCDHSGGAAIVHHALERCADRHIAQFTYIVHGHDTPPCATSTIQLTQAEHAAKQEALTCHASQLLLSRKRMMGYAGSAERFYRRELSAIDPDHPIRYIAAIKNDVEICVKPRHVITTWGKPSLYLLATDVDGQLRSLKIDLVLRRRGTAIVDLTSRKEIGTAAIYTNGRELLVHIPVKVLGNFRSLLAKVQRRYGLYDQAGWRPMDLTVPIISDADEGTAQPVMDLSATT